MNIIQFIAEKMTVELLFLIAATIVFLWVAIRLLQRGADPADLVMGDDGKLSWTKTLGCVGGTAFTYGFIHFVAAGTITEWYFNGFGVICFGTAFAYKLNALRSGPPTQPPKGD